MSNRANRNASGESLETVEMHSPETFEDFLARPDLRTWIQRMVRLGLSARLYCEAAGAWVRVADSTLHESSGVLDWMVTYGPTEVEFLAEYVTLHVVLQQVHDAKLSYPDYKVRRI